MITVHIEWTAGLPTVTYTREPGDGLRVMAKDVPLVMMLVEQWAQIHRRTATLDAASQPVTTEGSAAA